MPIFEDLPNEVLSEILLCLSCVDLRNISLVSHFVNVIAEPFLYASISGKCTTQTWITPLLRTILARPVLGRHVRVLHFNWYSSAVIDSHSSDHTLFSTAARRLGLSDRPWREDAQARLLLHFVPNLQDLKADGSPLLYEFLQSGPTSQLLPSLRRFVEVGFTSTVTLLAAVMQFPSIREITVHTWSAGQDASQPSLIPFRGKSPVTHMSLIYGNTTNFMLNEILQVPRALTHFTYGDSLEFIHFEKKPLFSPPYAICARPFGSWVLALEGNQANERTIGSLYDWPALKTVKC